MSIGRSIRILIIEDDPENIGAYRSSIDEIRAEEHISIVAPVIAGGMQEAIEKLGDESPYHVVILDLKLPETSGGDPEATVGSGLDLIPLIVNREVCPIPVLLILTGEPSYIQRISGLVDQLHNGCFNGIVERKGLRVKEHIRTAIESALKYVDFGLSVRDDSDRVWPPISPREEDLLRRFGLRNETYASADLKWWHAEAKPSDDGALAWTKVLMGHFWLKDHDMKSRSFFFKFEASGDGRRSVVATKKLESFLQHVQVPGDVSSDSRSLLVTAHASYSGSAPLSLAGLLNKPQGEVVPFLEQIVDDIVGQLEKLGTIGTEPRSSKEILWRFHESQLDQYDLVYEGFSDDEDLRPSRVFRYICESSDPTWITWRSCQHGDLHLGNISIDFDGKQARALLIDAGSMEPGPAGKDLAALEVAIVLHQASTQQNVLPSVKGLYCGSDQAKTEGDDDCANLVELLRLVRTRALEQTNEATYRLLLLDHALIQLGGLAYGSLGNRVKRPSDAIDLYRAIAGWIIGREA